ncbi:MAG: hypothetical protein ACFFAH_02125 [Promethearchaeota archaeon]
MTETSLENIINLFNTQDFYGFLNVLGDYPPDEDKFNFTLGGDIEGLILNKSGTGYIRAKDTKFNSTSSTAWVGMDGAGDQIEFRYKPSKYPHKIVENFQNSLKIFKNWISQGNSKGVVFGYYPYSKPVGGHIHFGKSESQDLVKKLDYYLAIPLLLVSDAHELSLRCQGRYGKLSSTESKSYGFEYRTLGSFPINATIATEVYVLAGLIADKYRDLPAVKLNDKIRENYNKGNKIYFIRNHLSRIERNIFKVAFKRFIRWGWALSAIINFFTKVNRGGTLISSNNEILLNWNLLPKRASTKHKTIISNDDYMNDLKLFLLNEISQKIHLDENLYIYGVKDGRSSNYNQIWMSEPLYDTLRNNLVNLSVSKTEVVKGCYGKGKNHKYSIGLAYKFRRNLHENLYSESTKRALMILKEVVKLCVA